MKLLSVTGLMLVPVMDSYSATTDGPMASTLSANPIDVTSIFQVLTALFIVIIVIFALAWVFKKYGANYGATGSTMKVVSAISLGGKEKAVVLQVGDEQLVIGVSPGYVKKLHVLEKPINIIESNESSSFLNKLNQELHKVVTK